MERKTETGVREKANLCRAGSDGGKKTQEKKEKREKESREGKQ